VIAASEICANHVRRGIRPIAHPDLAVDVLQMALDGVDTDYEVGGDFLIEASVTRRWSSTATANGRSSRLAVGSIARLPASHASRCT
jgi:hypothetical protein